MTDESKHDPSQPVVKGADVIYRPSGNAGEYAPLATNPYERCGHGCKYCYVPNAMHISRPEFNKPGVLRDGYMDRLAKDAHLHGSADLNDIQRQIFITFSSDPWHPGDDSRWTRSILAKLTHENLAFCTLTKSGTKSLMDADMFRPDHDAYAASLTSLDDRFSKKWEPNAALPGDRIEALKRMHDRGIYTWVSIEPTLDVDHSIAVIKATHKFVCLYKVGRANYLKEITATTDWRDYTLRIADLMDRLDQAHYIKADLQPHLPPNYRNPLRVPQHH